MSSVLRVLGGQIRQDKHSSSAEIIRPDPKPHGALDAFDKVAFSAWFAASTDWAVRRQEEALQTWNVNAL